MWVKNHYCNRMGPMVT
uniref:Uncharacterized protein n=1 Tax=Anguilla anguilla TaxID=7936 RepID=A0A0E9PXS6_ANGAN